MPEPVINEAESAQKPSRGNGASAFLVSGGGGGGEPGEDAICDAAASKSMIGLGAVAPTTMTPPARATAAGTARRTRGARPVGGAWRIGDSISRYEMTATAMVTARRR